MWRAPYNPNAAANTAWQSASGESANSAANARYSDERFTRWTRRSRNRRTPRRIQSIAACRWVSSERSCESRGPNQADSSAH